MLTTVDCKSRDIELFGKALIEQYQVPVWVITIDCVVRSKRVVKMWVEKMHEAESLIECCSSW